MKKISKPTKRALMNVTRRMERVERSRSTRPFRPGGFLGYWEQNTSREQLLRELKDECILLEAELVEIIKTGEAAFVALTQDGAVHALKERIAKNNTSLPNGTSCLITFDIPEDIRHLRNQFRHILKSLGFTRRQLSVWETNKDTFNDLMTLISELGIQKWVHVYKVSKK